jgi:SAM-dependent methyltransferase
MNGWEQLQLSRNTMDLHSSYLFVMRLLAYHPRWLVCPAASRLSLQADLCRLPKNLVQFDAVLAVNVLERLPDPANFLDQLSTLVKANGIAVLASAFSWSEKCTAKDSWLGGFYKVNKHHMPCHIAVATLALSLLGEMVILGLFL